MTWIIYIFLLTEEQIKELIPKMGPRLKFLQKLNQEKTKQIISSDVDISHLPMVCELWILYGSTKTKKNQFLIIFLCCIFIILLFWNIARTVLILRNRFFLNLPGVEVKNLKMQTKYVPFHKNRSVRAIFFRKYY